MPPESLFHSSMNFISPRRSILDRVLLASALGALISTAVSAQAPARDPKPLAVQNVAVEGREGSYTLLLSDGRIAKIQAASEDLPAGYTSIDGEGLHAAAAFMDASAEAGLGEHVIAVDQDQPVDTDSGVRIEMRRANRKGIDPSWTAASAVSLDGDKAKQWAKSGFSSFVAAPRVSCLRGKVVSYWRAAWLPGTKCCTRRCSQHAAFRASGDGYPSTLMGYHAQLRQFFYDAGRHRELKQRYEADGNGPRPPHDPNLDAALALLDGKQTLACAAESARDVHRWLKLADEFGLKIMIVGGREAWKMADQLKASGTAVVLTLDWPEEVDDPREEKEEEKEASDDDPEAKEPEQPEESAADWEYEEPSGALLDKRLRWEEMRDSAIRLHEADVTIAFGSGGEGASQLLEHVTELVENGLSRDAALAGLGSSAASLVGASATWAAWLRGLPQTFAFGVPRP